MTREVEREPLLADETVPPVFLPSRHDGRAQNRLIGPTLGLILAALLVGAVVLGLGGEQPSWHPLLEPYVEFVEAERGLEFSAPVPLSTTDVSDYEARNVPRPMQIRRLPELDQAFFLLGIDDLDPAERLVNGAPETIFYLRTDEAISESHYIIETGHILLRQDVPEEALSLNIVHELTRALQHQNNLVPSDFGDIPGVGLIDESDSQRLFDALVEGDAARIERAYYDQMTEEERAAYHQASGSDLEGVRHPMFESDRFTIGAAMTSWIVQRDGVEALNAMLRLGPHGSTDQFVDVLGEFGQTVDAVSEADLPDADHRPLDGLGAYGWFMALAPHLGSADAFDAIVGYEADAFVILNNPNVQRTSPLRTCLHAEMFFDSVAEADEFADIVTRLETQVTADVRSESQSVRFDICERLGQPLTQPASVTLPLILAHELAAHHLAEGLSVDAARCAAITQAKTVDPELPLEDLTEYRSYIDDSASFVEACL